LCTFGPRSAKRSGVLSLRLLKTLIRPPFSAIKTRPSAANSIAVGLTRVVNGRVVSWKPCGSALARDPPMARRDEERREGEQGLPHEGPTPGRHAVSLSGSSI
jgi:hypothetical protein